ncbi:MAG TPA: DUF1573 domain-containing protein [Chitinophagales bacterium]|jgi:hypothetical protein|nr:DUF1573 domain-containing protein [Chitinophagales bacterium]
MNRSILSLLPLLFLASFLLWACQKDTKPANTTTNNIVAEETTTITPTTESVAPTETTVTNTDANVTTPPATEVAEPNVAATAKVQHVPTKAKLPKPQTALTKTSSTPPPTATDAKANIKDIKAGNKLAVKENTVTTSPAEEQPIYKGVAKSSAAISFDETTYEFGTVVVGTKIEHNFGFKNTGTEPLLIEDAKSTCGCTIPDIPLEPIMPGQSNKIHVMFDTKGKVGEQTKVVTILTNAGTKQVTLKGTVLTENMMKKDKKDGESGN